MGRRRKKTGLDAAVDAGKKLDKVKALQAVAADPNVNAAGFAAQLVFGTVGADLVCDGTLFGNRDEVSTMDRMKAAATFVRANPDAPPAAAAVALKLSGLKDLPEAEGRALVAWKVFALALRELDALDAAAPRAADPADAAAFSAALGGKGPFDADGAGPFDAGGFRAG